MSTYSTANSHPLVNVPFNLASFRLLTFACVCAPSCCRLPLFLIISRAAVITGFPTSVMLTFTLKPTEMKASYSAEAEFKGFFLNFIAIQDLCIVWKRQDISSHIKRSNSNTRTFWNFLKTLHDWLIMWLWAYYHRLLIENIYNWIQ